MSNIPEWMVLEPDENWDSDDVINDLPGYTFYNGEVKLFFEAGPHVYFRYDNEGNRVDVAGVTTVLNVINKDHLKAWAAKLTAEYIREHLVNPDGSFKQMSTEEFNILLHDAKAQHKVRLGIAGDIGHLAHESLEKSIQHAIDHTQGIVYELRELPENELALSCVQAAFKWMQLHNVRWESTERKIYSRLYDFAGTTDGIGLVDSCTDLKCCRGRTFSDRRSCIDWKSSNQTDSSYAYQTSAYLFALVEETGNHINDRWVLRLGKSDGEFEPWFIPADYFALDLEAFLAALNLYRSLKEITERRKQEAAELRGILKAQRDAAKAIQEAQERLERLEAKKQRMAATAERNAAKERHYKNLRSEGWSAADAKAETSRTFPKPEKEAKPEPTPKPTVPTVAKTFEEEWTRTL